MVLRQSLWKIFCCEVTEFVQTWSNMVKHGVYVLYLKVQFHVMQVATCK